MVITHFGKLCLINAEFHGVWDETSRVADDERDDHNDGGARVLGVPLLRLPLVDPRPPDPGTAATAATPRRRRRHAACRPASVASGNSLVGASHAPVLGTEQKNGYIKEKRKKL